MFYNGAASNNVGFDLCWWDYDGRLTIDGFVAQQIDLKLTCLASSHLVIASKEQKA